MIDLILGGARSGKSRLAEQRANASGLDVIYIATAQSGDHEMRERIAHHQRQRPAHWLTVEEPLHLASAIARHADANTLILVDCLTLWITNLLCQDNAERFSQEKAALLEVIPQVPHLIMVSNETGLGVVPLGDLTRRFVDESGWLHQTLAAMAHQVTLVVAGLPHLLKSLDTQPYA